MSFILLKSIKDRCSRLQVMAELSWDPAYDNPFYPFDMPTEDDSGQQVVTSYDSNKTTEHVNNSQPMSTVTKTGEKQNILDYLKSRIHSQSQLLIATEIFD